MYDVCLSIKFVHGKCQKIEIIIPILGTVFRRSSISGALRETREGFYRTHAIQLDPEFRYLNTPMPKMPLFSLLHINVDGGHLLSPSCLSNEITESKSNSIEKRRCVTKCLPNTRPLNSPGARILWNIFAPDIKCILRTSQNLKVMKQTFPEIQR